MASNEARIKLIIEALLKDKGLLDAQGKIGDLEKKVATLKGRLESGSSAAQALGSAFKSMMAPVAALFTLERVGRFIYEAAEAQRSMARENDQLRAQLRGLKVDVDPAMQRIELFTRDIANLTGIVDDETVPALRTFLGLTGKVDSAMASVKVAAILAKGGFGDFAHTTEIVTDLLAGKLGPAAKALGINLKTTPMAAEQIWRELGRRINEMAPAIVENERNTARLAVAWDDFGDSVGDHSKGIVDGVKGIIADGFESFGAMKLEAESRMHDAVETAQLTQEQLEALAEQGRQRDSEEREKREAEERKAAEKRIARAEHEAEEKRKAYVRATDAQVHAEMAAEREKNKRILAMNRQRLELVNKSAEDYLKKLKTRLESEIDTYEALDDAQRAARLAEIDDRLDEFRGSLAVQVDVLRSYLREKEALEIAQAQADARREIREKGLTGVAATNVEKKRDIKFRQIQAQAKKWEEMNEQERRDRMIKFAGEMAAGLAQAFPKIKAFAIAEALINAYAGVNAALSDTSLPTIARWAAAAVSLAMGLAQVQNIRKTKPMALGGMITGPTAALIGEDVPRTGPELVAPLSSPATHRLLGGIVPQVAAAVRTQGGQRAFGGNTYIVEENHFHSLIFDDRTLRDFERKRQGAARRDLARFISRRAV